MKIVGATIERAWRKGMPLLLALAVIVNACGGTTATPPDPAACDPANATRWTAADYCAMAAFGAQWAYAEKCCNAEDLAWWLENKMDYPAWVTECTDVLSKSLDENRVTIDPCAAAQCARVLAAPFDAIKPACAGMWFDVVGPSAQRLDSCLRAVVGHQPAGAPCDGQYECGNDLRCVSDADPPTAPGRCERVARRGESCLGNLYSPAPVPERLAQECADPGDVCEDPTWTCQPAPDIGEACVGSVHRCGPGAWCVLGTCQPEPVSPPGEGEPCEFDDCAPGLFCVNWEGDHPGTCQRPLPAGSTCDPASGGCDGYCDAGICVSLCGSR